jgi:hypothetical protein
LSIPTRPQPTAGLGVSDVSADPGRCGKLWHSWSLSRPHRVDRGPETAETAGRREIDGGANFGAARHRHRLCSATETATRRLRYPPRSRTSRRHPPSSMSLLSLQLSRPRMLARQSRVPTPARRATVRGRSTCSRYPRLERAAGPLTFCSASASGRHTASASSAPS